MIYLTAFSGLYLTEQAEHSDNGTPPAGYGQGSSASGKYMRTSRFLQFVLKRLVGKSTVLRVND